MSVLKAVVRVSQIVFGTDYPYFSAAQTARGIQDSGVFTAKKLRMIDSENAMRFLPTHS